MYFVLDVGGISCKILAIAEPITQTKNRKENIPMPDDVEFMVEQMIGALVFLEGSLGRTPSVDEIAEQANCSPPTARAYLQRAVGEKRIVQRDGKYMSIKIARAFDEQGKDAKQK
jgi:Fic family protein